MRTYRSYQHVYRPGRRGVIKVQRQELDKHEELMHALLILVCVIVAVAVVVL